ncbi:hypothetical protein D9758_000528 [Tetrapyrgos nigripes]|uniref:Uncharacterized protein n=1 Tax=Tetrapyrgos nigripes TaxID=182062 RepID=A0A8H5H1G8_9AGAR|nr:hypothetical protein D9758_000528 [Tetrapyrgos nigripes]
MYTAHWRRHISNSLLKYRPARNFSQTTSASSHLNPPLNLDPSLQALLKDVDISLTRHNLSPRAPPKELDVVPYDHSNESSTDFVDEIESELDRKSPAALFGSQRIGAVVLPLELQNSINLLITESDKPQLHLDAKRLFQDGEDDSDGDWFAAYNVKYRSHQQNYRHRERDGTAFASVALPAHYSAIRSVLEHAKHRLGPDWSISRVIDWGAATGSTLWASLHTFYQKSGDEVDIEGFKIADSSLASYVGIDKRDGLVSIGKRLLQNAERNELNIQWQRSYREDDRIPRDEGHDVLAISAFHLSSLPNGLARKQLVKEMWESGAHTMVLIDHSTTNGFENIAAARELLLKLGKKELESGEEWSVSGCHVVAPCPHDGKCPLYHPGSGRSVCGFSQRLQRPSFVRRTKHSGIGHEDIGYSYVVVKRGTRPVITNTNTKLGRVGAVGMRELRKQNEARTVVKELTLHSEDEAPVEDQADAAESEPAPGPLLNRSPDDLENALRQEAYSWPRLVFNPLKKVVTLS